MYLLYLLYLLYLKVQDEKAEGGAKYIRKDRQQLEKIPTDQLADHYEVYYDRQPGNHWI